MRFDHHDTRSIRFVATSVFNCESNAKDFQAKSGAIRSSLFRPLAASRADKISSIFAIEVWGAKVGGIEVSLECCREILGGETSASEENRVWAGSRSCALFGAKDLYSDLDSRIGLTVLGKDGLRITSGLEFLAGWFCISGLYFDQKGLYACLLFPLQL